MLGLFKKQNQTEERRLTAFGGVKVKRTGRKVTITLFDLLDDVEGVVELERENALKVYNGIRDYLAKTKK